MSLLSVESPLFSNKRDEINKFTASVAKEHQLLHSRELPMTGWVDYPVTIPAEVVSRIKEEAANVRQIANTMVVIGIGGSFLGAKACCDLLRYEPREDGVKVVFAGWNLSDEYHAELLRQISDDDVVLCVVSKSGSTVETSMAFNLFKDHLMRKYGESYRDRIYAITDEKEGLLRLEAEENGYKLFGIDENIGGRYSILTVVGLFPIAVQGYDIEKLISGARRAYNDLNTEILADNLCYQYAVLRYILFEEGRYVEAFSVMAPHLYVFSEWLKQLFAESEGKNKRGVLPFSVRYSTDLHSVGQFLEEGHPICFESILELPYGHSRLPASYENKTYKELSKIVCDAVYKVRQENNTPIFRFSFKEPLVESCGYALYFFEKACAMCCLLQGIDPFDQPGVEIYKAEMLRLLKEE